MSGLTPEQVSVLLKPIRPNRVLQAQDHSHIPAYDVAAHLTRVFGFGGWDKQILSLIQVCEEETATRDGKPAWRVTYSCTLRLIVKDPAGAEVARWDDGACGTSTLPQRGEAHDMAMKSAISYALKRCAAFGLGDQFGLSLYNKGSVAPLIGKTLVDPAAAKLPAGQVTESPDLEAHIPEPQSLGNDERQELEEEPTPPPPPASRQRRAPTPGESWK